MFDFLGDRLWAKILFGIILVAVIVAVFYVAAVFAIFAYIDYKMGISATEFFSFVNWKKHAMAKIGMSNVPTFVI